MIKILDCIFTGSPIDDFSEQLDLTSSSLEQMYDHAYKFIECPMKEFREVFRNLTVIKLDTAEKIVKQLESLPEGHSDRNTVLVKVALFMVEYAKYLPNARQTFCSLCLCVSKCYSSSDPGLWKHFEARRVEIS